MAGTICLLAGVLATVLFLQEARPVLATLSVLVTLIGLWSWLHMRYFARSAARDRLYMEAVNRGEIEHGTEAASQYWRDVRLSFEASDAQEIPDWITRINMLATIAAIALAIWAGSTSALERNTVVDFGKFLVFLTVEFLAFWAYGRALFATRPRSSFAHFVLNPVMDTVVITGSGSLVLYALKLGFGYSILGFLVMLIFNAYAVLTGRILLGSKLRAGAVFSTIYALIAWLYFRGSA